jgi:hypothetical protein
VGYKWFRLFPPLRHLSYSFRCPSMQAHHQTMTLPESSMLLRLHWMRNRVSMQERRHSMTCHPLYSRN